jgi:transposase
MRTEYIGIDLHKAFFQVCAVDAEGERRWEGRFPTTAVGVSTFAQRCHRVDTRVAVEATGPVWSFVDQVVDHVALVVVVDPRKTKLKAGYAAKTDRLDARRLADALRRDSVVAIYYPPIAVRQLRELCRYRGSLVRVQVALKQRLHALLLRQGVPPPPCSDLFGRRGQQWLTTVRLPGWAGESFRGLLTLARQVRALLDPLEAVVAQEAHQDPIVRALDRIPGLGPVLALMIRAEIGTITRFTHPAQLASYAGVVPHVYQSGGHCRYGGITREGSPWLRWALVEAAVHGVKRQDAIGRWARRLAVRKGGLIARVAVARRLCDEIFWTWPTGERVSTAAVDENMTRARRAS